MFCCKLGMSKLSVLKYIRCSSVNTNSLAQQLKTFTTTTANSLKKINIETEGNVTTVEGTYYEDSTDVFRIAPSKEFCPTCPNKLGFEIDYTDVLIISQFVRPDGCLLPQRATGLCFKAHERMKIMVHKAQVAGLMYELRPYRGSKEPVPVDQSKRRKWKKNNVYFEGPRLPYRIP